MYQKKPKDKVSVHLTINEEQQVHRFTIEVPFHFVRNSNFLEAMEGFAITNIPGWLEALANVIRQATREE